MSLLIIAALVVAAITLAVKLSDMKWWRNFYMEEYYRLREDVRVEARKREKLWLFARSLVRQKDEMQRVIIGLQGQVAASGEVSRILLDGEAEKQADLLEKIDTARRDSKKYRSRIGRLEAGVKRQTKLLKAYRELISKAYMSDEAFWISKKVDWKVLGDISELEAQLERMSHGKEN